MSCLKLIKHAPGAPGLRLFGLGPQLIPSKGMRELQNLLNNHAFWARNRNYKSLRKLLHGSTVIVTLWQDQRLVGFGRATSDQIYRAVLWDIVVADDLQGKGLGRLVFQAITQRDLIVVESVVMLLVFAVITVNFIVDVTYAIADPRLRRRV